VTFGDGHIFSFRVLIGERDGNKFHGFSTPRTVMFVLRSVANRPRPITEI
jgi:hypothetical protein